MSKKTKIIFVTSIVLSLASFLAYQATQPSKISSSDIRLTSMGHLDTAILAEANRNKMVSAESYRPNASSISYSADTALYTVHQPDIIIEEKHNEKFKDYKRNSVKLVKDEPISTFAADVDDGSYKMFLSRIKNGHQMDEGAVRIEEFINAFQYNYASPKTKDIPFSTEVKIVDSPWSDNKLLKIGVKGYEYSIDNLPPVNLVFLIDVSGSMSQELPVIKTGLKMLVNKLRPSDRISLVTYAGATRTVLKSTLIEEKHTILNAISDLNASGGTHGEAGIKLAYREASDGFIKGGVNRILLMSDGDFNVGVSNTSDLKELIKKKRKLGITFSTIGLGGGNYNDHMMESMSNVGNGMYTYISNVLDAETVFASRFISTLKNIAKDVKYQIEFNPNKVKEYRLIGYENRMLNKEDFNNDKIDAGEIPSGITTTAIYEITFNDQKGLYPESRYEKKEITDTNDLNTEIAYLKIRYKEPNANKSKLLEFIIDNKNISENVDDDTLFSIAVAGFAQIYKNSDFISSDYSYEEIVILLESMKLKSDRDEFLKMVKTVKSLNIK